MLPTGKTQLKLENDLPTTGDALPWPRSVSATEDNSGATSVTEAVSDSLEWQTELEMLVHGVVTSPSMEAVSATGDSPAWQATIEQVIRSVVSIHFRQICSLDGERPTYVRATGFVVDATRRYILTNRHVSGAGPIRAYWAFGNHEQVGAWLLCGITTR